METGRCLGGWVGVACGVGDAGEAVVAEGGFGAGVVAEERARFVVAFDDVVFEAEGGEVGGFVEAEETVVAVFCGGACDDVIVSDGEVGVGFVHPDDAAAWVGDEVVVEEAGAGGGFVAEGGDEIPAILFGVEVEEIVIDFDAVADELDGVGVAEPVVVDVEGAAAFGDGTAGVFGDGDGGVEDVVID